MVDHTSITSVSKSQLIVRFTEARNYTLKICQHLEDEDYSCQPELFVSPPKWHLAHTTWFFEEFICKKYISKYNAFDHRFAFLFNSYYETAGDHLARNKRGSLTRPTIKAIRDYRTHVDQHIRHLLEKEFDADLSKLIELGINHEQQHQELLFMDIKYILGTNPLYPAIPLEPLLQNGKVDLSKKDSFIGINEGVFEVGSNDDAFSFDNERPRHKVYLQPFEIAKELVSSEEYLDFVLDGGYTRVDLWLSDGWEWVKNTRAMAPLYWKKIDGIWCCYNFNGLQPLDQDAPVLHVNYYEADAFAKWKNKRLPTEFEWEVSSSSFSWGSVWEHTASAYLPYPGYKKPEGTIGEYNAKFMSNQMVLRGASLATPKGHERTTYRNFFSPEMQWQFSGFRLAKSL